MTMTSDQSPQSLPNPPSTVTASVLAKDKSIVKIAVQRKSYLPQLIEFDQSQPLTVIIKQLCGFWMIEDAENYALQFSDHPLCKYVTEKNRNDIKNGSILQLDYSVPKTVAEILHDLAEIDLSLSGSQNLDMLEKLLMLSSDPIFASEFNANKGLNLMIEKIESSKLNDKQLALTITSFLELMEHGFVSWDSLSTNFLPILNSLLFTSTKDKDNSFKIIKATLQILENIVLNSGTENLQKSNNEVLAKSLQSLLDTMDFDDQKQIVIQQNILALLNALILKADEMQRRNIVVNFDLKPIQYILMNKGESLGTEMAHQLYVLQQLILNFLFEDRMFRKIDSQDTEALEKIRDLKRIAFESDICTFYSSDVNIVGGGGAGGGSNAISCGMGAAGNSSGTNRNKNTIGKDYRKLGFKNDLNPLLAKKVECSLLIPYFEIDFSETPPGILALDCMHYFAITYPDQYVRIVLENSCRHDQYECPFVSTSIALVKVLCELFRIGEPANDQADHYYPIFFSHSRAFEQIFTIAISLLNKTWREMKASTEDFVKVFAVVREQLSRALQTKPRDLDAFRSILKTLSYNEIIKLWQQERNSREEWESHAKPIVELKELIIPEILELIKQRRLNYLCEGTRFVKYTNRGQRIKDKFWFIKLSSNRKVFHYGDCNEIIVPTIEELPNKVTVADIRALVTGKECPHMKDSKGRKATYQLAFSLMLDTTTTIETDSNSQSLNFVAQTDQVYTYWTDGICALLNQPMISKETELDLETLLSMEIKLRLLDVEGIDIPQEPPIVPPEPLNFDFYCTQR